MRVLRDYYGSIIGIIMRVLGSAQCTNNNKTCNYSLFLVFSDSSS